MEWHRGDMKYRGVTRARLPRQQQLRLCWPRGRVAAFPSFLPCLSFFLSTLSSMSSFTVVPPLHCELNRLADADAVEEVGGVSCTGGSQRPPVVCLLYVQCACVNTWAGRFQSTPCPCQSRRESGPWGRSRVTSGPAACRCARGVACCPGKCPCGSKVPDLGVWRLNCFPRWCPCSRSPPGLRTTQARIAGGYARSTRPG